MKKYVLITISILLLTNNCFSQSESTITVVGSSDIITQVSRVLIGFNISTEGPTLNNAQENAFEIINNIINALFKKYNITKKDIIQTRYSVEKKYDNINDKKEFKGYIASVNYTLSHKLLDKQKDILDCLADNKISEILSVDLESDINSKQIEEAYIKSFENAKFKANALLKQSGLILGPVIKIIEHETSFSGTGFNPEGPPGIEGQVPPTYKDLNMISGMTYTRQIEVDVTFKIKS